MLYDMKHKNKGKVQRVQVTFTEEQWVMIEKFKNLIGTGDAEVVRNIVLTWLAEKSIVSTTVKIKTKKR